MGDGAVAVAATGAARALEIDPNRNSDMESDGERERERERSQGRKLTAKPCAHFGVTSATCGLTLLTLLLSKPTIVPSSHSLSGDLIISLSLSIYKAREAEARVRSLLLFLFLFLLLISLFPSLHTFPSHWCFTSNTHLLTHTHSHGKLETCNDNSVFSQVYTSTCVLAYPACLGSTTLLSPATAILLEEKKKKKKKTYCKSTSPPQLPST